MSELFLMAWSSPASAEVDDEFNSWYDGTHIPQVTQLLNVSSDVARYRKVGAKGIARYLAIYEVGSEFDAKSAGARLGEAMGAGELDMTPTMDVVGNPPQLQWLQRQD